MKIKDILETKSAFRDREGKCDECGDEFDFDRNLSHSKHEVVCPGCGALLDCDYAAQTLRLANLNEIFDPNYYDFLQDEMRRKKFDPDEDLRNDTETDIQDFIISNFEAGNVSFEEAKKMLQAASSTPLEYQFWRMELVTAAELLDD